MPRRKSAGFEKMAKTADREDVFEETFSLEEPEEKETKEKKVKKK